MILFADLFPEPIKQTGFGPAWIFSGERMSIIIFHESGEIVPGILANGGAYYRSIGNIVLDKLGIEGQARADAKITRNDADIYRLKELWVQRLVEFGDLEGLLSIPEPGPPV
ncbi:MAG: hypothetical protein J0L72_10320 [Armatimonadetes bacterium]|nr:hypothetical protein [Armatimonadota bacterium]